MVPDKERKVYMRRLVFVLGCLLGFVVVIASPFANAQDGDVGLMNAISYMDISKESPIAVRPLDNSDDNMILQHVFEKALSDSGYKVASDAPLILTFETRDMVGAWSTNGYNTMLELRNNRDRKGSQTPKVLLNIYNSSRGGVFNKGKDKSGTRIVTPSQYRMDVSIDNRNNGKRLWQAWTVANKGHRNSLVLTKSMVPVIVSGLGRTVKRMPFDIH